ncbi:hypothetical protein ONE63_001834 [Megalurothrips usitatus]|uniref:Uncharacterized protein n=1 Tax=Megalurothrips usitatus TaxID=439358 RepID=A0AAV7XGW7_9NEOP|nr:hypothetical protein ONE63_001834 [Megalurothrips usitatus]
MEFVVVTSPCCVVPAGAAAVRYHQLRRARRKAFRWPLCWAVLVLLYALVSDLLAAPPAQPVGSTQPATPAPTARQVNVKHFQTKFLLHKKKRTHKNLNRTMKNFKKIFCLQKK